MPTIGRAEPKRLEIPLPEGDRATVLVVDDEADILEAIEAGIRGSLPQVQVLTARSGAEALAILAHKRVNLIITDYKMPGMNGLEFLAAAQGVARGTPSIMISAFPDPKLVNLAVHDYGVRMFIAKPFDLDYFVDMLRTHLFPPRPG